MERISACLIVKDEEELLPQCLDSIVQFIDEIILVDTGSIDATLDIAEEYGCKVYHYAWTDDFSAARNESLKHATGDWLLVIDADEVLTQESIAVIQQAVESTEHDALAVTVLNKMPQGWSKHHSPRLFRRERVKYQGIVHNQPIFDGKAGMVPATILHYGYNLSPDKMAVKYMRTEALLRKQVEADPKYVFGWQNLVRALRVQGKHYEAVSVGRQARKRTERNQAWQMISVDVIDCLASLGRLEESAIIASEVLEHFPDNIDAWYYQAKAQKELGNYSAAITSLNKYLEVRQAAVSSSEFDNLIIDTWGNNINALRQLGILHIMVGEYDEALGAYRAAVSSEMASATFRFADIADSLIIMIAAEAIDIGVYSTEFAGFIRKITNRKESLEV